MWNSIESEGLWQDKIINKTKCGLYIPIWSTIKAIKDTKGNVINYIAVQTDLREIESVQEKIDYLAYHDQLTGLYNRVHFEEYLEHALTIAKRKQENLALLFIDLDRFKVINDTLGHDIGDKVLIEVAKRLRHTLRESDFISRWGGDEFVIILENTTTPAVSAKIASHIIAAVKEPIQVNSHSLSTTASVGIALYPQNGDDAYSLVKHADSAMYLAKDKGKNQFQYYTKELSNEIQSRLNIELSLRDALKRDKFYLVFQPQYSLKTKETERFVMAPTLDNMSLLQNFRAKGFRISIDDFGTGYSSMAYLKNLPADTIKIDKTFVDDIEKGSADNAIIKAIIALSKTLGYSIVAEGIETKEEEDFLTEYECDYGQGYLFSRPILVEEVIKRFAIS